LLRQQSLELSEEFEWDDFSDSFKKIEAAVKAVKTSKSYHPAHDIYSVNVTEIKPEMLTETAYNSVSRGGLGLLSGIPILQQQKTWLEIVARLAIATVSDMKSSDKLELGLSSIIDQGTPQAVAGGNWQAVSALGKQEQRISQLSGLDAYRAILIEIEDVADLAEANDGSTVNSGLNVWKLLRGNSDRQRIIEQLEHQLYC
ncbi:MAG: hypothetical protein SWJ54_10950, partial [Cyanobacteriota bacterium]|nr:hypothetical protein [Cyanobacteriota bacterium]